MDTAEFTYVHVMQSATLIEHTAYEFWALDMDKHLILTTNQEIYFFHNTQCYMWPNKGAKRLSNSSKVVQLSSTGDSHTPAGWPQSLYS